MLSRTSQYALRAMIYLAKKGNRHLISGAQISAHTRIPAKYLTAVLRECVRSGILESTRGKGGGYRLTKAPQRISLLDTVSCFEPRLSGKATCPFGNKRCSAVNPCLAHDQWTTVNETLKKFLGKTSLQDVAFEKADRRTPRKRRSRS